MIQRQSAAILSYVLCLLALVTHPGVIRAQCMDWVSGPQRPIPGVGGAIATALTWDPDGPGPQQELLIVGGSFIGAGSSQARYVAAWDGTQWLQMGALDDEVKVLCIKNGELYAGGAFGFSAGSSSPRGVARWDGATWQPVGGGVSGGTTVTGLGVFADQLYVAGDFTGAGITAARYIATWNGTTWKQVGTSPAASVRCLVSYQGALYAGSRGRVMRLTAGEWVTIPEPFANATIDTIALTNLGLTVGASTDIGGGGGVRGHLYAWNGSSWTLASSWYFGTVGLAGICEFGSGLYLGTDSAYHSGGGYLYDLGGSSVTYNVWSSISAVCGFRGSLFAGGYFGIFSGIACSNAMLRTNGVWNTMGSGMSSDIQSTAEVGANRYVISERQTGDAILTYFIWRQSPLGWTLIAQSTSGMPTLLKAIQGQLWASDVYVSSTTQGVVRYDGSAWGQVGTALHGVTDLAEYQGVVACKGSNLYKWNGTAWSVFVTNGSGSISHLLPVGNSLIVGGSFATIAGVPASNIALWNGSAWSPLGAGLTSPVISLAECNGEIWAITSGPSRIWRFSGGSWSAIPLPPNLSLLKAVASFVGKVYITGYFGTSSATAQACLVWNGSAWETLGSGATYMGILGGVQGMDVQPDHLTFYGAIGTAGGTLANGIATWGFTGCAADFNCDGGIDGSDTDAFFHSWERGDDQADVNHDGGVDGADVQFFFARWEAGC